MGATVSNETGPTWFVFDSSQGTPFAKGDKVDFFPKQGAGNALLGARVLDTKTTNFGNPPKPCLQLSLAIESGDLGPFANGGFEACEIRARVGNGRASVHPGCKARFQARLMKNFELQQMFDRAQELIETAAEGKNEEFVKKWFGSIAPGKGGETAKIYQRCAELHQGVGALSSVTFEVVGGEFLGGIDPKVKAALKGGGNCRIQLGRGFAYTRYSWGERVATIVHELTHWILGTVDAKYGNSDAYGAISLAMTRDAKECSKGLNNADNWAFYICEYRGQAQGEDWRFFSEEEMKQRPPFSQDPKNTDMLLIV